MALLYLPTVSTPTSLHWGLFIVGLIGMFLAVVAIAQAPRVAARNVAAALCVVALLVLATPAVLCCWCPPDPTWLECVLQPWCCL